MEYKLVINNEALWTEEAINFYERHSEEYGFTSEMANSIRDKIKLGEQVRRVTQFDNADYYSIMSDSDKKVGELKVFKDLENDEEELIIAIFESHKKIAEKVIRNFIESYAKAEHVVVAVKENNRNHCYIKTILTNIGFGPMQHYNNSGYDFCYVYDRTKSFSN